eukprot:TRINITY_DN20101_c0_g1_i1.p1 TRINITY_DN20101_c0_g1~~TRINITY_DN20101_c0_g1_i1.p1  ORF type:complete len:1000 (+),score=212.29 TRINITY_DN20101_c0_g1_i1:141-3140(+)
MPPAGLPHIAHLQEVLPAEPYTHYTVPDVPLHACRLVEKLSSKGKWEPRVLVVNRLMLSLTSTQGQKVHRIAHFADITGARTQRTQGAPLVHLVMESSSGEPDIVFRQTMDAQIPASGGDGSDIVELLSQLRQDSGAGQGFTALDVSDQPGVDISEKTCQLRKGKDYLTPKVKVARGDVKRATSPPAPPSKAPEHPAQITPLVRPQDPVAGPPPLPAAPADEPTPPPAVPEQTSPTAWVDMRGSEKGPGSPEPLLQPTQGHNAVSTHIIRLSQPGEELGIRFEAYGEPRPMLFVASCRPGGPWARSGVPLGELVTVNGVHVTKVDDLVRSVQQMQRLGVTEFPVQVAAAPPDDSPAAAPEPDAASIPSRQPGGAPTPLASSPAARRPGAGPPSDRKALVVAVSYWDSQYELTGSASAAAELVGALTQRGALAGCEMRQLIERPGAPEGELPTRSNLTQGLEWLVADAAPGATRYFIFVGHGMNLTDGPAQDARDGSGEAVYPSDFQTSGVIQQEEISAALRQLPQSSSVLMLCDCCSAGTMVDLAHKLKAPAAGGPARWGSSTVSEQPQPAARCWLISTYRDTDADAPAVSSSGGLARAVAAVLQDSAVEPQSGELLSRVRAALAAAHPPSPPAPMVSCSAAFDGSQPCGWLPSAAEMVQVTPPSIRESVPPQAPAAHAQQQPQTLLRPPQHMLSAGSGAHALASPAPAAPAPAAPQRQADGSLSAQAAHQQQQQQQHLMSVARQQQSLGPAATLRATSGSPPRCPSCRTVGDQLLLSIAPLSPEELGRRIPQLLSAPGFVKSLAVHRRNGVPELFYAAEAVVLECAENTEAGALWPSVRHLVVGRRALYILDGAGEVDRCVALADLRDFVLLKGGAQADPGGDDGGPYTLPGSAGSPWLAALIPSQYDLLMQPTSGEANGFSSPQQEVQGFLQVVNVLLQQGAGQGTPARVLVVERDAGPGLLRLRRPVAFSYPWIPVDVRIWPDRDVAEPLSIAPVS